jgi:hypothetical protein
MADPIDFKTLDTCVAVGFGACLGGLSDAPKFYIEQVEALTDEERKERARALIPYVEKAVTIARAHAFPSFGDFGIALDCAKSFVKLGDYLLGPEEKRSVQDDFDALQTYLKAGKILAEEKTATPDLMHGLCDKIDACAFDMLETGTEEAYARFRAQTEAWRKAHPILPLPAEVEAPKSLRACLVAFGHAALQLGRCLFTKTAPQTPPKQAARSKTPAEQRI